MPVAMPAFYRPGPKPGFELPLYWRDEVSGILREAVTAYLNYRIEGDKLPSPEQLQLLRSYFQHYINAPCWTATCEDAFEEELSELRSRAQTLSNVDDIAKWIFDCLEIGLDPL